MSKVISLLPTLNAILNATSAVLLCIGYRFIRRKNIPAHKRCMLAALAASSLFLISYGVYHLQVGSVHFPGHGWVRPFYFAILISHTALAIVIVPLVLRTVFLAARGRFKEHEAIARRTLPLWLYVCVTGVVVYWMLYRVQWGG